MQSQSLSFTFPDLPKTESLSSSRRQHPIRVERDKRERSDVNERSGIKGRGEIKERSDIKRDQIYLIYLSYIKKRGQK